MTAHDARWSALMVLVIAMGAVMMSSGDVFLGVAQMLLGTLSLGIKMMKLVRKE